jgi:1-acyl-sn-glycerol-3-phosphate acyltransferase
LALHAQRPRTDQVPSPPAALLPYAAPLARAYYSRHYDVHLAGMEHIPAAGPVLLAANHIGILDGPLLGAYAGRPVHAVVKREMFQGRMGAMLLSLGQIPVQRDAVDPRAVRQMLRVLRDGGVVSIYPEGARGTGDFAHSRLGAAYLALCSGAPVVPVACLGPAARRVGVVVPAAWLAGRRGLRCAVRRGTGAVAAAQGARRRGSGRPAPLPRRARTSGLCGDRPSAAGAAAG